jgi:hypothetical protein
MHWDQCQVLEPERTEGKVGPSERREGGWAEQGERMKKKVCADHLMHLNIGLFRFIHAEIMDADPRPAMDGSSASHIF